MLPSTVVLLLVPLPNDRDISWSCEITTDAFKSVQATNLKVRSQINRPAVLQQPWIVEEPEQVLPRNHPQIRFWRQPSFRLLPFPECAALAASIDDKYLDERTLGDCVFYCFRVPDALFGRLCY